MSDIEEFQPLTPNRNADKSGHYSKAITYAIKHKSITNIALTGPFGSGKSSIIETYVENNQDEIKSITVSLAEFGNGQEGNEQLPKIEKSILQQIFYQRSLDDLPYSRFGRIKHYTDYMLNDMTSTLLTLVLIILVLFNFSNLGEVFKAVSVYFHDTDEFYMNYIFGFIPIFLCATYISFRNLITFFSKTNISTLKLQSIGEISLKNKNESVLNHYLDEIVYFFERTEVDVVFFEDLDRFKNIHVSIFTKLRELNHLLNKSASIKQTVNFVYALKDDMFEDSEVRTKFFDFVIPVIPYVNQSNSAQVLEKGLFERHPDLQTKISKSFVKRISYYVPNMRTIINIQNEFHLYLNNLQAPLKSHKSILTPEKLLGFIVYKNVYPKDFADLNNGEGVVVDIFTSRNATILALIQEKQLQVQQITEKLHEGDDEKLKDIEELNLVTLFEINKQLKIHANALQKNNQLYLFDNLVKQKNFEEIVFEGNYLFYVVNANKQPYQQVLSVNANIELIKKLRAEYSLRLRRLSYKKEQSELRREKYKLEEEIQDIRLKSVKDIYKEYPEKLDGILATSGASDQKDFELLKFLISGGFIDDNYNFFLTYHHEGGISLSDLQFIHDVRAKKWHEYTYSLTDKQAVYEELKDTKYLQSEYALNIDLVEHLLGEWGRINHPYHFRQLIESVIKVDGTILVRFILEFITVSRWRVRLIQFICEFWSGFWDEVDISSIDNEEREELFKLVINNVSLDDILGLDKEKALSLFIGMNKNFLSLFEQVQDKKKLYDVLEELQVQFESLGAPKSHDQKDFIEYIYRKNFYALTPHMIEMILSTICPQNFNRDEFLSRQLSVIFESECDFLKKRIEKEWDVYISEVYIELQKPQAETKDFLTEFVNKTEEEISQKYIERVIEKQDGEFEDLSIFPSKLFPFVFSKNKVIPSWKNVLDVYQKAGGVVSYLFEFLNRIEISKQLSEHKLLPTLLDKSTAENLSIDIMQNDDFSDEVYENLLSSIYWHSYASLDVSDINSSKVSVLINKSKLKFNKVNYDSIADYHPKLKKQFIRENFDQFVENYSNLEANRLSDDELSEMISINYFSINQKLGIINLESSYFIEHFEKYRKDLTYAFCDNLDNLKVDYGLLQKMLSDEELVVEDKVTILNTQLKHLAKGQVLVSLESLGGKYKKIAVNKLGRQVFENTPNNRDLLNKLFELKLVSEPKIRNEKLEVHCKSK